VVLTFSTMMPLGTKTPEFALKDVVNDRTISNATFADKKALLVIFMCKHCPYVIHIQHELAKLSRDYENKDIGIVGISSNDADSYPEDGPAKLKSYAQELDYRFPLCYDESQDVAKRFYAACTPDFFLFDRDRHLVYRGQFDDSRKSNAEPINGKDLRAAIDAVLAGNPVPEPQKPSTGCNIKWKAGNEPSYFSVAQS
jgi:peroxiredoxin